MSEIKKTTPISGQTFIERFCAAHGIPSGRVTEIIIDAKFGEPVYVTIRNLGTYRLLELVEKDNLGNITLVDDDPI